MCVRCIFETFRSGGSVQIWCACYPNRVESSDKSNVYTHRHTHELLCHLQPPTHARAPQQQNLELGNSTSKTVAGSIIVSSDTFNQHPTSVDHCVTISNNLVFNRGWLNLAVGQCVGLVQSSLCPRRSFLSGRMGVTTAPDVSFNFFSCYPEMTLQRKVSLHDYLGRPTVVHLYSP